MVRIEYLKPTPKPKPVADPYALIPLIINDKPIDGRPVAFDSVQAGPNSHHNAQGDQIRPTRCTTVCPDCAQGLEFDLPDPLPHPLVLHCSEVCKCPRRQAPRVMADPFWNPHLEGLMELEEVDTNLVAALGDPPPEGTVAQRVTRRRAKRGKIPVNPAPEEEDP